MKNKDSYLQRKAKQLHQWERVLDNLMARAHKSEDKEKSDMLNQIENIKAKKVSLENQLKQMKASGDKKWQNEKDIIEKSWKELRDAFSNSAVGS